MIRKEALIFSLCLVISFVLWGVHQLNQTYIREYHLKTFIVDIPDEYERDSLFVDLKIKVKGSSFKILLFEKYFPEKIFISFKKLKRVHRKPLFFISDKSILENKDMPVKIKVIEIQPDTISMVYKNKKKGS